MDLQSIEKEVVKLCKEVAKFIAEEGRNFDRSKIEFKSSFNNLVSYVDQEAERKLVQRLKALLPEAGFITEEGTVETTGTHTYNWIIDPLDGTTNFLHALPVFAISIGLVRDQTPILGVVYEVNRNECFHAIEGGAAFCNDQEIRVSGISTLDESLLATGFPYYHLEKKEVYLSIIQEFLDKTHGIRRLGSAAIDLAYVACGRLDGFFEYNLNPWDVAGGAFILQQAGGKVSDFRGDDNFMFGRELCGAGANLHAAMLEIIKGRWYGV